MKQIKITRAKTSASNLFRRDLCPGSERMEGGLAEEENEYSAEGQLLHRCYMNRALRPADLTPEQIETLDAADNYTNEYFTAVQARFNIPLDARYVDEREVTLEVRDAKGELLFPGHADLIRTWPEFKVRAIADAKFGWLEVEDAQTNTQLAGYALGRHQQSPGHSIAVAIIQPRNFGPRVTKAVYLENTMPAALAEVERIIRETRKPDAPLRAGKHQCHYCKAKAACSAYQAEFMAVEPYRERAVDTLPNDDLVRVWGAIQFGNKIRDEVNEEMRKRVNEGKLPGFKLRNTGDTVTVKAGMILALFKALQQSLPELTAVEFDSCRKLAWGDLEKILGKHLGSGEKKTKEWLKPLLEPYVDRVEKAKSVVPEKAAAPALEGK